MGVCLIDIDIDRSDKAKMLMISLKVLFLIFSEKTFQPYSVLYSSQR